MPERRAEYTSISEPLPAYSSTWGNDFVSDGDEKRGASARQGRVGWLLAMDSVKQRTGTIARKTIPVFKKIRFTKKQSVAFGLFFVFVVAPFFIIGIIFGYPELNPYGSETAIWIPFAAMFSKKLLACGDGLFDEPQNSTVSGVEALFTLDFTFGSLPFSQVKLIDIAWDLVVGRGMQLWAWYVSYIVFSDALLRVIERHPTSFRTFARICLEGPCLGSMGALSRDLFRTRSRRTVWLFVCMLLSTAYVLALPTVLGAMTGYVSTSIAWVAIDASNDQIVPASSFREGYFVTSAINDSKNITMNSTCTADKQLLHAITTQIERISSCKCQVSNGTLVNFRDYEHELVRNNSLSMYQTTKEELKIPCFFNYTNNDQTFKSDYDDDGKLIINDTPTVIRSCNNLENITISGHQYHLNQIDYEWGFCHGDVGYNMTFLRGQSRCLPDTANPSFQWGFSSMLSAVFIIVHFIWGLNMYSIWQDAQFNSKLVQSGFRMTQLRAAFSLTAAAENKTGMENPELVRAETKGLEAELMGAKRKKLAVIGYDIFKDGEIDAKMLRKRRNSSV